MIKLFGFGKKLGLLDPSPFVMKVHVFLRMANIEYKSIASLKNLRNSPKGKLPYIEDGDKTICDSQAIIDYLKEKYASNIDSHLSQQDKATSYLIGNSLDKGLYWCLLWGRWQYEPTWEIIKREFFKKLPFPFSAFMPNMIRKKAIKALKTQGTGKHSDEEIIAMADRSFQALSGLLTDKPYFFGDQVSSFDATAYAFIDTCTQSILDTAINTKAKSYKNLVDYAARMKQEFFADGV